MTIPDVRLPFKPETVQRLQVRAVYLEGQIDLKQFCARHPRHAVLYADPLLIEPTPGSFVVLTKFGSVVFWNCGEETQRELLADVALLMNGSPVEVMDDRIDVLVGAPENAVTFNEIALRALTLDRIGVISLAVAQSVALDHIEQEVAAALGRFAPVVRDLRSSGSLRLAKRDVLKAIGFALQVRSAVLANLTLFDKPPQTWESESLERLDSQLWDFFDLEERTSAINQKAAYFTDMSGMLMNLLSQRRGVQLEVGVIVLIAIEVVVFLWSIAAGR